MLKLTLCSWSAKKNYHLSDSLLRIIEDNLTYKVALRFYKGDVENVPNGGKGVIEHHQSISCKLFINIEGLEWTEEHVKQLGESVKNRVTVYVFWVLLVLNIFLFIFQNEEDICEASH